MSSIMKGIVDENDVARIDRLTKWDNKVDSVKEQIKPLEKQMKTAKENGDMASVRKLQKKINALYASIDQAELNETEAKKGADGKRCWKGKRYAGTVNGKDKCIPVDEAGSPAQQAAIAINMKKHHKKPKHVDEAKAKPYVKPFYENGKQVGWKSSDGYHVKYWQMFAKASAIKHAKLNPDEVQEDYTGEFAAEKTPTVNPHAGIKDNQFRGAISEMPDTSGPIGTQPGGWRKYKPKSAGELDESRMHQYNINDAVKKVQEYHRTQGSPYRGAATRLLNALYQWQNTENDNIVTRAQLLRTPNMGKQAMALLDTLLGNISKDESPYDQNKNQAIVILDSLKQALTGDDMQSILDLMRELKNSIGNMDRLSYKRVREDTAYAGGMGQGGNAGESYRKFTPKSAGTFKESAIMKGILGRD